MLRLVQASGLALFVGTAAPVLAQAPAVPPDAAFQLIRDWDAFDQPKTEATRETLRLTEGRIWTPRAYDNFIFRFEYRPLAPAGGGDLLIRSSVDGDGTVRSYGVRLTQNAERGRLSGERQVLHEVRFTPGTPAAAAETWIAGEVRAEGDALTVSLDGTVVSAADRTESLFGTIGFRAGRGGIELRGMRVAPLTAAPRTVGAGLPKADDPGLTAPKAIRRVKPRYTRAAVAAQAHGVTLLEFVIEPSGAIGDARVVKAPHPDLAVSSMACLRQWRFTPARKDGTPIAVVATMELSFDLQR